MSHDNFRVRTENVGPKAAEELNKLFDSIQEQIYSIEELRSSTLKLVVVCEPPGLKEATALLKTMVADLRSIQEQLASAMADVSIAVPAPKKIETCSGKHSNTAVVPETKKASSGPASLQEMLKTLDPDKKPKASDDAGGSLQQP